MKTMKDMSELQAVFACITQTVQNLNEDSPPYQFTFDYKERGDFYTAVTTFRYLDSEIDCTETILKWSNRKQQNRFNINEAAIIQSEKIANNIFVMVRTALKKAFVLKTKCESKSVIDGNGNLITI